MFSGAPISQRYFKVNWVLLRERSTEINVTGSLFLVQHKRMSALYKRVIILVWDISVYVLALRSSYIVPVFIVPYKELYVFWPLLDIRHNIV